MDKTKKHPVGLLETESLATALPEKSVEGRPKYAQILTPAKSPNGTNTDAPMTDADKKPSSKKKFGTTPAKHFSNNNRPQGIFIPKTEKRPFNIFLKKQEVVALPADVKTREMPISEDNVEYFSGPNNYLSALYSCKVIVDGNEYNSVEHFYQACKLYTLLGQEKAAELKATESPIDVKKATKALLKEAKVSPKKIEEWKDKDSIGVLKHVILAKFEQNEELKAKLLETGDKILIQTYFGDTYFAAGANPKYMSTWISRHVNQSLKYPEVVQAEYVKYLPLVGNGKNILGWILMQIRDEIRAQPA